MQEVEASGRSVDDAIRKALEQLGADRDEVEVEVLSEGRSGLLGFYGEEARVRVRLLPVAEEPSLGNLAREVLSNLLTLMGIAASIRLREASYGTISQVSLEVWGDNLGIIIGRRGSTLDELQYLVNLILGRRLRSRVSVSIDIEGYRRRREDLLRGLALRMAERVRTTGRSVTLYPMPPAERRIVHMALQHYPDVATQSTGDGEERQVTIFLKTASATAEESPP